MSRGRRVQPSASVGGRGCSIVTVNACESTPAALVAPIVNDCVPEVVGVPEIAPVDALIVRPAGSAPAATDHVIGAVPVALTVCAYASLITPDGSVVVVITGTVTADAIVTLNAADATPTT